MTKLEIMIDQAKTIAVLGHVNPDGDCAGSCLAVYNYVQEQYADKTVTVYLEPVSEKFSYLRGYDQIQSELGKESVDLCICLDCSDQERFGKFKWYLDTAAQSICIDHHITNQGFAMEQVIDGAASSTCEVLFTQLTEEKVTKAVAECIYTGIIHDTGVFRYSNTSKKTMEIAGKMEGIVEQLRVIDGVECAIFLYEVGVHMYKVSLRSNKKVDVSKIAAYFGGGGHMRAAGCTMSGSFHDVINNLSGHIEKQLSQET